MVVTMILMIRTSLLNIGNTWSCKFQIGKKKKKQMPTENFRTNDKFMIKSMYITNL